MNTREETKVTDRQKIVWLATKFGTHEKSTLMCEWIGGRRFYFDENGELEKVLHITAGGDG